MHRSPPTTATSLRVPVFIPPKPALAAELEAGSDSGAAVSVRPSCSSGPGLLRSRWPERMGPTSAGAGSRTPMPWGGGEQAPPEGPGGLESPLDKAGGAYGVAARGEHDVDDQGSREREQQDHARRARFGGHHPDDEDSGHQDHDGDGEHDGRPPDVSANERYEEPEEKRCPRETDGDRFPKPGLSVRHADPLCHWFLPGFERSGAGQVVQKRHCDARYRVEPGQSHKWDPRGRNARHSDRRQARASRVNRRLPRRP